MPDHTNTYPKLHNATWPGVVGKGSKRNVRLLLRGKQYSAAVSAHRRRQPVTSAGELEKKGREWWMRSPSFEVIHLAGPR